MIFDYSGEDDGFLRSALALDAAVYPEKYRGTIASVSARFKKNEQSFVLMYENAAAKSQNELAGYICFFPISEALGDRIASTASLFDDNILPDQILSFFEGESLDVYMISIVVAPQFQGSGYGKELLRLALDFLEQKHGEGAKFRHILATAIHKGSESLLSKFGFCAINKTPDGTVMKKDFAKS